MLAAMVSLFSAPGVVSNSFFSPEFALSAVTQGFIVAVLVIEGVILSINDKVCYLTAILLWKACP
jgi:hypothetical protein